MGGAPKQSQERDGLLARYDPGEYFCEMFGRRGLAHTREIRARLNALDIGGLRRRARDAENELFNLGITFTVYSDRDAIDRILPFDVIPRVVDATEWRRIETGLTQRLRALNDFIDDLYQPSRERLDGLLDHLGLGLDEVVAVVNSHLHFDHCGQNPALFGTSTTFFAQAAAAGRHVIFTVTQ